MAPPSRLGKAVEQGCRHARSLALGISEATMNFHRRQLFWKIGTHRTGTHRQADLVKLAVGFVNPLVR